MELLEGGKAVITGGGASVGRVCVEPFQSHGARVAFFEIDEERAHVTEQQTGVKAYIVDIADKAAVESAIAHAADVLGGINLLVKP